MKMKSSPDALFWNLYIKLKSCLSVTLITCLGLTKSTYQLPNTINPLSSYFKFATASERGDQIAFSSRLKTKEWRKLKQHSIENHSRMAQWVEQLTCIQEVAGSNPASEQIFFFEKQYFCMHVFKNSVLITLLLGIPSTHQNGTWTKLNARHLGFRL